MKKLYLSLVIFGLFFNSQPFFSSFSSIKGKINDIAENTYNSIKNLDYQRYLGKSFEIAKNNQLPFLVAGVGFSYNIYKNGIRSLIMSTLMNTSQYVLLFSSLYYGYHGLKYYFDIFKKIQILESQLKEILGKLDITNTDVLKIKEITQNINVNVEDAGSELKTFKEKIDKHHENLILDSDDKHQQITVMLKDLISFKNQLLLEAKNKEEQKKLETSKRGLLAWGQN